MLYSKPPIAYSPFRATNFSVLYSLQHRFWIIQEKELDRIVQTLLSKLSVYTNSNASYRLVLEITVIKRPCP